MVFGLPLLDTNGCKFVKYLKCGLWKLLLRANNKPQWQERRPLKIHFTIQLGYFTGVKKEGGMPESILVQYMASFIYILWRRMGQQQGPLFHLLTQKMILPLGP